MKNATTKTTKAGRASVAVVQLSQRGDLIPGTWYVYGPDAFGRETLTYEPKDAQVYTTKQAQRIASAYNQSGFVAVVVAR